MRCGRFSVITLLCSWLLATVAAAGELADLVKQAESAGLSAEAKLASEWEIPRSAYRQTLFLPPPGILEKPGKAEAAAAWQADFLALRKVRAEELLKQAQANLADKKGALAYQQFYEALRENPDEAKLRRVLG